MMEVESNPNHGASEASLSTVTYNRPVSALEDPANYNIRHPLQSKWTLWYRASTKPNSAAVKNAAKSDNWEASLQCVNTVDTIEDFWGMYNNVPGIDKMEDSSDYMFFKEGIRPAWEDPANANGGSFTIQFKGSIPGIGEFVWLNTLMMVVGSTLTHFDKVTGIVYAKRSNRTDRLSLWLSSNDREICRQSESEWLELLQKVNQEGFNIGSTSFTNHKGSGHHHRDRDNRGDRGERDNRGDRDYRDNRGDLNIVNTAVTNVTTATTAKIVIAVQVVQTNFLQEAAVQVASAVPANQTNPVPIATIGTVNKQNNWDSYNKI